MIQQQKTQRRPLVIAAIVAATAMLFGGMAGATASQSTYPWDSADIKNQSLRSWDLAPNSVGNSELVGNAVSSPEVAYNSLNGWDIENGTLTHHDVQDGTLGLADLSESAKAELQGAAGTDGVSGYEVVGVEEGPFEPGIYTVVAECPADKVAVGGGTKVDGAGEKAVAVSDGPTGFTESEDVWSVNAWTATFDVTDRTNVTTYVLCATA